MTLDGSNEELRALFLKEAWGYVRDLRQLAGEPGVELLPAARILKGAALLHNLKGVSAMLGFAPVQARCEAFEDALRSFAEPDADRTRLGAYLGASLDALEIMLGHIARGANPGDGGLAAAGAAEWFQAEELRVGQSVETAATGGEAEIRAMFAVEAEAILGDVAVLAGDLGGENAPQAREKLRERLEGFAVTAESVGALEIARASRALAGIAVRAVAPGVDAVTPALDAYFNVVLKLLALSEGPPEEREAALAEGLAALSAASPAGAQAEVLEAPAPPDDNEWVRPSGPWQTPEEDDDTGPPVAETAESIDPEFAALFIPEARELLETVSTTLMELEQRPQDVPAVNALFRALHTLKGSAATVGLPRVASKAHALESLLEPYRDGRQVLTARVIERVFAGTDDIVRQVEDLEARETVPSTAVHASSQSGEITGSGGGEFNTLEGRWLRVEGGNLDTLMDSVGRMVVEASHLKSLRQQMRFALRDFEAAKAEMRATVRTYLDKYEFSELSDQAAPALAAIRAVAAGGADTTVSEFGGLEWDRYDDLNLLVRKLEEADHSFGVAVSRLAGVMSNLDDAANLVERQVGVIKRQTLDMRMVPLGEVFSRLRRTVRDAAARAGKEARLNLIGQEHKIDKVIGDAVLDPLTHLLRNAVAHGIEPPLAREAAGKSREGQVTIRARPSGSRMIIEVEDDGAGLNLAAVTETAVRRGLISEAEAATLSDEERTEFIFLPGFTTENSAVELSGRGVGLDVVRHNVARVRGALGVSSTPGRGAKFTLTVPLTLAVMPALVIGAENQVFAVPTTAVHSTVRVYPGDLERRDHRVTYMHQGRPVPCISLHRILGAPEPGVRVSPAVILGGVNPTCVLVDELRGFEDVVIQGFSDFMAGLALFTGTALLGDGRLCLVIEPAEIHRLALGQSAPRERAASRPKPEERPRVLVADDSLSIRRVISQFLLSGGYETDTAIDGTEALEMLQERPYHLLLTDLEMPQMHGLELIKRVRAHAGLAHLPIIVLSSRTGKKHRDKAMEAGADDYITKPAVRQEILDRAGKLIREPRKTSTGG